MWHLEQLSTPDYMPKLQRDHAAIPGISYNYVTLSRPPESCSRRVCVTFGGPEREQIDSQETIQVDNLR